MSKIKSMTNTDLAEKYCDYYHLLMRDEGGEASGNDLGVLRDIEYELDRRGIEVKKRLILSFTKDYDVNIYVKEIKK